VGSSGQGAPALALYADGYEYSSDRRQHCYVTGGSSGLGLALALLLTKRGADVSIVARDQAKLDKALEEMQVGKHDRI
jgi:short-subunit dehydrogenase